MRGKRLGLLMVLVFAVANLGASGADLRLLEAAKHADATAARALLRQGLDVNARAGDGATALHWAAYRNDLATAELLIAARASVNAVNDLGVTPLWVATTTRSTAVAAALLKAGADPNIAPSTGGTPLMLASRTGDVEAVKLLVAHGANPNTAEDAKNQTALMWAVVARQPQVVQALLEGGADVHARTESSRRRILLCCAAFNGDSRGIAEIDHGAFTPLMFAAREGEVESTRLLLDAGARVNDTAADGASALALAALSGQGKLAELLIDRGADLNAAGAGYAALHAAVLRSDKSLVQALLARGANPNVRVTKATQARRSHDDFAFDKNYLGATPFLLAAREGEHDLMRILAAGGADVSVGLDDGTTPLMVAARGEQEARVGGTFTLRPGQEVDKGPERKALAAVKVAMELGVAVNAANQAGDTALHVAALKRFDSVIQFLADSGATLDVKNAQGETPTAVALKPLPPPEGTIILVQGPVERDDGGRQTAEVLRKLGARE